MERVFIHVIIPLLLLLNLVAIGWGYGFKEGTHAAFNRCADWHHLPRPF